MAKKTASQKDEEEVRLLLGLAANLFDPTNYEEGYVPDYEEYVKLSGFLEVIQWKEGTRSFHLSSLLEQIAEAGRQDKSFAPTNLRVLIEALKERIEVDGAKIVFPRRKDAKD